MTHVVISMRVHPILCSLTSAKTINEVHRLNGRVTALGQFISCSTRRYLPFFKALKGQGKFEWEKDCAEAFESLKTFLSSPSLLSSPVESKVLFLYLSIT
ncbi:hypothetical protein MANES_11G117050v8 [Manihot esculenta]|uniref:Uncharacterized protein n=1 Tax=Manihot esculenta TaxID=3983 RepID=A0ACB7GWI3_MANES|nr:hypothetical protein MANES_11G117050v8 [Manihot esculenta]